MRPLLLIVLLACSPGPESVSIVDVTVTPVEGAEREVVVRDHAGEVTQALKHLERLQVRLASYPTSHQLNNEKGQVLFTLARLRGGTSDLEAAEQALVLAWATGSDRKSVRRTRAVWLQKSHRFEEALAVIEHLHEPEDLAFKASLRFELGDYEDSVRIMEDLLAEQPFPDPSMSARLAVCLWKLGRFEQAEQRIADAQHHFHGREQWIVAWHHLLLGLMDLDRGFHDEAMSHYAEADDALPGWWLVQEHIAEIHVLQGRPETALPIYRAVVEETGSPELMAALADTQEVLGHLDRAAMWRERALLGFEEHLASNPSAAGGHALAFFIDHGEPGRAVQLARANAELRPNGEAKWLLADALEQAGEGVRAAQLRAEVETSGWWIPED